MTDLPDVVTRFLRYVTIDTQSDPNSDTVPSTAKQKNLCRLLVDELLHIGISDASMDEYGYVFGTLGEIRPDGLTTPLPVLALVAHVDTAPDESGADVKPIVHPPYDGSVLVLPGNPDVSLDPGRQPSLRKHTGERLITSDGTTLLGSDDKAGVAILMQLAADLVDDTSPRPKLRLCFTIDEEIGRGVDHLDLNKLGADVAYTLDGSGVDTISFETFNAASANITIRGVSVHPGYAKGVLVNAVRIAGDLISSLPEDEAPETTENREGYIHPHTSSAADVTRASVMLILRDFTNEGMNLKKQFVTETVERLRRKYPGANIELEIKDQYKNMRSYIENKDMRVVTFAFGAAREAGITLEEELVRGGTDGSRLSEMGLPTPNVFNGGYDYHSLFEWNTVENLEHSLDFIRKLIRYWALNGAQATSA